MIRACAPSNKAGFGSRSAKCICSPACCVAIAAAAVTPRSGGITSPARKLGTCAQRRSCRRADLEALILDLLRDRLMQPAAVASFISAYGTEVNAGRAAQSSDRVKAEAEKAQVLRRLEGLYDAIADGLRTPGLKQKLDELEARKVELESRLAAPLPSPVRLHPGLSELYRKKVEELAQTLADPAIRTAALEIIRGLITSVTIHEMEAGIKIELEGAITAMIGLAQPYAARLLDHCSVEVVAGARFQKYLPITQTTCRPENFRSP